MPGLIRCQFLLSYCIIRRSFFVSRDYLLFHQDLFLDTGHLQVKALVHSSPQSVWGKGCGNLHVASQCHKCEGDTVTTGVSEGWANESESLAHTLHVQAFRKHFQDCLLSVLHLLCQLIFLLMSCIYFEIEQIGSCGMLLHFQDLTRHDTWRHVSQLMGTGFNGS